MKPIFDRFDFVEVRYWPPSMNVDYERLCMKFTLSNIELEEVMKIVAQMQDQIVERREMICTITLWVGTFMMEMNYYIFNGNESFRTFVECFRGHIEKYPELFICPVVFYDKQREETKQIPSLCKLASKKVHEYDSFLDVLDFSPFEIYHDCLDYNLIIPNFRDWSICNGINRKSFFIGTEEEEEDPKQFFHEFTLRLKRDYGVKSYMDNNKMVVINSRVDILQVLTNYYQGRYRIFEDVFTIYKDRVVFTVRTH